MTLQFVWVGRATCGQGDPAGATSPTQTKYIVNSEGYITVPFGRQGKWWCSPMPIRQWAMSLAGSLPTSGQGQGAKQCCGVRISCPLVFGSESSLPIPHPEGSPPPHYCSWLQSAAHLKDGRKGPEQLFKRGWGWGYTARKDTAQPLPRSRGGPVRACACLCVRCDDKAPLPSASSRLLERGWGRGRESSGGWNPRSRR